MNGLNAYGLGAAASAFGTLGSSGAIRIPQGDPVRELSDAGTNSNDLNQNDAEESQTG